MFFRYFFVAQAIQLLKKEFEKVGLKAEISGYPQNTFSIYQKMQKYDQIVNRRDYMPQFSIAERDGRWGL
jgi:(p)ppGpp synthase/HD superfamily hydrolase